MKRSIIAIAMVLGFTIPSFSAGMNVIIDERVELTSIVFRLAGAEEYVTDSAPAYMSDIDSYFGKYRDHALIEYVKKIRPEYEICYGGVMSIPSLFTISKGRIKPRNDLDYDVIAEARSWPEESIMQYIGLLDRFYRDTRFASFYAAHQEMRDACRRQAESVLLAIDWDWFDNNFRKGATEIDAYICMANGPHNYGGGNYEIYKEPRMNIHLGCSAEKGGVPVISNDNLSVALHEIMHGYTNPLVKQYGDQCIDAIRKFYPEIASKMKENGYGDNHPEAVFTEWLTELFNMMYEFDTERGNRFSGSCYHLMRTENRGYMWMSEALRFMDNYYRDRHVLYECLDDFMPQIVGYINGLPDKFAKIQTAYEARFPYIESTYPAKGTVVSCESLKVITIIFSEPMFIGVHWNYGGGGYEELPRNNFIWSEDHRILSIFIDYRELKPDAEYGLLIPSYVVQSKQKYPMKTDYLLTFKTE